MSLPAQINYKLPTKNKKVRIDDFSGSILVQQTQHRFVEH